MSDRPKVFADTETTGRGHLRRPWEIALIYEDGHFRTEQTFVVTNIDLTDAEPEALAMNGFHDRHRTELDIQTHGSGAADVTYAPEADVAGMLHKILTGVEWIGAQPQFDTECVAAMLRRHGFEPAWHYRLRDCESMTQGFLRRSVGGLQDCARALGVPVNKSQVHSALGDARLVEQIWRKIHEEH